jgi:hypothetical protein
MHAPPTVDLVPRVIRPLFTKFFISLGLQRAGLRYARSQLH